MGYAFHPCNQIWSPTQTTHTETDGAVDLSKNGNWEIFPEEKRMHLKYGWGTWRILYNMCVCLWVAACAHVSMCFGADHPLYWAMASIEQFYIHTISLRFLFTGPDKAVFSRSITASHKNPIPSLEHMASLHTHGSLTHTTSMNGGWDCELHIDWDLSCATWNFM